MTNKYNTAKTLRSLINKNEFYIAPGISDGLSAILVKQAGFSLAYASGGAIARSTGKPDIGILSLTEVRDRIAQIVEVAGELPIVADADTGFGNEINVEHTVHLFEQAGAAGFHIEDQVFPKRCGHLAGKALIPCEEMCLKIKVACQSRSNPDTLIIARTDAIAVEGFDAAIVRMQAYIDSGADMAFVEAPETIQQIETIAKAIPGPKLINMFYGGKTPLVPKAELQAMGYNLAIIPSDIQRACIHATQQTLKTIYENGDSSAIAKQLATFKEREQLVDTQRYLKLAETK